MSILEHIRSAEDIRRCSFDELNELCAELRAELIRSVSATGGHLAANLGVVELTVALHNVFDPMKDRIVFDVGHQCYVHKMLTGRLERQINIVRPRLLVCLGRIAAMRFIDPKYRISREHGQWVVRDGMEITAIYHPAALLRDPRRRPEAFDDMKDIARKLKALS